MRQDTFDTIVRDHISHIIETLAIKGREYSTDSDRLHNFKRAAVLARQTPEMACRGMLAKHIVSVWDIVDGIETLGKAPEEPVVLEKIGDSINYLILLRALISERLQRNRDLCTFTREEIKPEVAKEANHDGAARVAGNAGGDPARGSRETVRGRKGNHRRR